jgi:hypothetical protein
LRCNSVQSLESVDPWRFVAMYSTRKISAGLAVLGILTMGCDQVSENPMESAPRATATALATPVEPSVVGASQEAPAGQAPVEFTGTIVCGPPVSADRAGTEQILEVGDEGMLLTRSRGGAWKQTLAMSDRRLDGTVFHTYETDQYALAGGDDGPSVGALTHRIQNDAGAWESRVIFGSYREGSPIGRYDSVDPPSVLIGEGGYDGLVAVMEVTAELENPCGVEVRGIIFAGAPVPEPFIPR